MFNRTRIVLIIFVLTALTIGTIITYGEETTTIDNKIVEAYKIVYKLGRMGIDVKNLIDKLNEAQKLIDEQHYDEAEKLIDEVLEDARRLEEQAPSIVFWRDFTKAMTVVCLASIPVLTYLFLPRIYLDMWYKLKRKWVVKK
ncbi:hypothetical protein J4526_05695 [Desulfurococcaceae archaeon MEX13E-LK6-19]|nr:hypothetical protein J4526_05695 [Desulfurococcaceae archaeon MEX13E-LK6-19]